MIGKVALISVVGLSTAALGFAALMLAPRTTPPIEPAIVNTVTNFVSDHPEWAVRREERRDAATVGVNHSLHMNPEGPQMQKRLAATGAAARAVDRLSDGRLSLTCASCHEQDAAGRYMEPIRFDRHCASCHTIDLPTFGGERVPHGTMPGLVDHVTRQLLRELTTELNRAAAAATPRPSGLSAVQQPGAGWLEGVRVESLAMAQPRKSGSKATPEPTAARIDVDEWLAGKRQSAFVRLVAACGKCHTTDSITLPPPDAPGEPFDIAAPMIPDRWLDRSIFSHQSHRALTCLECHEGAATGRFTADIMLPSIESCRQCHAPDAGVRSDCVMCHVYHAPLTPAPPGTITIEEYSGAGAPSRP